MIWTVMAGDYYLYDSRLSASDSRYLIFEPILTMELNKASTFTFTILPTHPVYGEINRLTTPVTVYRDDVLIFSGRLLDDTLGWNNERKMVCESDLAYLNDSFQRPYSFPIDDLHTTPADFFTFLIQNHNAMVGANRRFNIGTITVTDPNNYITRSDTEYSSTWSLLNDLLSTMGGYLNVRYSSGVRFIDWLTEPLYAAGQTIELGRNILELETSRKGSDIITALVPLGALLEEEPEENTDEGEAGTDDAEEPSSDRLTIEELPDGPINADIVKKAEYVYSQSAVERYGWIFGTNIWDDVTIATNLQSKAAKYLADKILIPSTVTIKAADLAGAGYDVEAFNIGDTVTVTDSLHADVHGLESSYVIEKLTLKLFSPGENAITVGSTTKSFTETNRQRQDSLRKDVSVGTKTFINTKVKEIVREVSSTIEQTEESIMTQVSETYMTKDDGSEIEKHVSTVEQTAKGLVTTVESKVNTTDFNNTVANLQSQIDDAIETFSGMDVPTLSNYPAVDWKTDNDKAIHVGDLYTVSSENEEYGGFYYRFEKVNGVYQWTLLKDTEITKALADAAQANANLNKFINDEYVGVNLLGLPYGTREAGAVITASGVTVTFNYDGSITFNGTATSNYGFYLVSSAQEMTLPDGKYTLGFNQETSGLMTYSFYRYIPASSASAMLGSQDISVDSTFTWSYANLGQYFTLAITFLSGAVFSNFIIKPQLEYGSATHAWQPVALTYQSQIRQESDKISLEVSRKASLTDIVADNLISLPYQATNWYASDNQLNPGEAYTIGDTLTVTCDYDGSLVFNGTYRYSWSLYLITTASKFQLPDGEYTIGFNTGEDYKSLKYKMKFYVKARDAGSETTVISNEQIDTDRTFTWSYASQGKYLILYLDNYGGVTYDNFTIKPQLEVGNFLHSWQPVALSSRSLIEQKANSIKLEVDNKVGSDEVIAKINLSAESESGVLISADKINLQGVATFMANEGFATEDDLDGFLTETDVSAAGSTKIYAGRIQSGTLKLGGSGNGNGILSVVNASEKEIVKADKDGFAVKASSTTSGYIELDYGSSVAAKISPYSYSFDQTRYPYSKLGPYYVGLLQSDLGGLLLRGLRGQLFLSSLEEQSVTANAGEVAQFNGGVYLPYAITPDVRIYSESDSNKYADLTRGGAGKRGDTGVYLDDTLTVEGSLVVYGSKPRAVITPNFGTMTLNAMESTYCVFSDLGSGTIGEDGGCVIFIDPDFGETIDRMHEYLVFTTQTSAGSISRVSKDTEFFAVYGEPGTTFDWIIYARQRDYEQDRLEKIYDIVSPERKYLNYCMDMDAERDPAPEITEELSKQFSVDYVMLAEEYLLEYESEVDDYDY